VARFPDAAVCDTHALAHHAFDAGRLGKQAAAFFQACDAGQAVLYVPAAVVMEFWFVFERRLARRSQSLRDFFEGLFANSAYQPYDLTPEQVLQAAEVRPNDDPFDRLICAAALRLDLPLITRDTAIVEWGRVKVIW